MGSCHILTTDTDKINVLQIYQKTKGSIDGFSIIEVNIQDLYKESSLFFQKLKRTRMGILFNDIAMADRIKFIEICWHVGNKYNYLFYVRCKDFNDVKLIPYDTLYNSVILNSVFIHDYIADYTPV